MSKRSDRDDRTIFVQEQPYCDRPDWYVEKGGTYAVVLCVVGFFLLAIIL